MNNFNKQVQKGFTLIELMIVVAIIAILVAIALPAYQDYSIRSKMSEVIIQAEGAKLAVAETAATEDGGLSAVDSNADAGFSSPATTYVTSVTVGPNGLVTAVANVATGIPATCNILLTPAPTTGSGVIDWTCSTTCPGKYVPATCR